MKIFSEILKEKFLSAQSNQFLLYGSVNDLFNFENTYQPLIQYLNSFLKRSNRFQIHYNIGRGITFFDEKDAKLLENAYVNAGFLGGSNASREQWFKKALIESAVYPQIAIKFIQECLKLKLKNEDDSNKVRQFSVIIDYAETIAANSPIDRLSDSDKQKLVILSEWLKSPDFINSLNLVIFISESISNFNEAILNLPSFTAIQLPRPNEKERLNFINYHQKNCERKIIFKCSKQRFANLTAGLTLTSIQHLFFWAEYSNEKLDDKNVLLKTNEILQKELNDIIEIYDPPHDLTSVHGALSLKKYLKDQIKLIKSGDSELSPVGILVSGPNGVGKTFIFEAFAKEIGYNIIKLKKIRSQWFGQTDIIFEKIKSILTSIGKVVVLIDEADTAFGGRQLGTHETEQRLFGNLIQMMGNPLNRGKIIWILITARPDRLEPDIKRSGRAGLHLPIFDPEGKEREEFISWLLTKIDIDVKKIPLSIKDNFNEITKDYSAADFNELIIHLNSYKSLNKDNFGHEKLIELTSDFRPSTISKERRFQTLVAASECSFESLIPSSLRDRDVLQREIEKLKLELRY